MHLELVARAIPGIISTCTSIHEFMVNSRIFGRSVARDVLHYLYIRRILSISYWIITFFPSDRLKTALIALQDGRDVKRVSNAVTWRDFEALTVEVLKIFGYKTHLNVRFKKPRSFKAHDCKHWKRSNISSISKYAKKQLTRTQHLLQSKTMTITSVMPVLLTLFWEGQIC